MTGTSSWAVEEDVRYASGANMTPALQINAMYNSCDGNPYSVLQVQERESDQESSDGEDGDNSCDDTLSVDSDGFGQM